MMNFIKYSSIVMMSIFVFAGVYFLKTVLNQSIPTHSHFEELLFKMPQIIFYSKFWLGICCYVTALIMYLFLLHNHQVSKIFTITVGINILLTNLGAFVFLGDSFTKWHLIGVILIIAGICCIHET